MQRKTTWKILNLIKYVMIDRFFHVPALDLNNCLHTACAKCATADNLSL